VPVIRALCSGSPLLLLLLVLLLLLLLLLADGLLLQALMLGEGQVGHALALDLLRG
jgi:hypothetical protein